MATCEELARQLQGLQNQLRPVFDEEARQKILEDIADVRKQQQAQGCLASIHRSLNGLATLWTDNSQLPGPTSSGISASLTILNSTGEVALSFSPLPFDNVVLRQNGASMGHYDFSSGALNLNVPIRVENVPIVGTITTVGFLSTEISITTPSSGSFAGSRVGSPADATGSIILVGTAPISVFIFNNTAFLRLVGTLSQ